MITGEIHTLEDTMRVVAGMMRAYHECDGSTGWLDAAERLEAVAEDTDVCLVRRDDAMRAVLAFLGERKLAEVLT